MWQLSSLDYQRTSRRRCLFGVKRELSIYLVTAESFLVFLHARDKTEEVGRVGSTSKSISDYEPYIKLSSTTTRRDVTAKLPSNALPACRLAY